MPLRAPHFKKLWMRTTLVGLVVDTTLRRPRSSLSACSADFFSFVTLTFRAADFLTFIVSKLGLRLPFNLRIPLTMIPCFRRKSMAAVGRLPSGYLANLGHSNA